MKRFLIVLAVLVIAASSVFAAVDEVSLGAEIAIYSQGVAAQVEFDKRWEITGALTFPTTYILGSVLDDEYPDFMALLSPELKVAGYFAAVDRPKFGVNLGVGMDLIVYTNGVWRTYTNKGKPNEEVTEHDPGCFIMGTLGPAIEIEVGLGEKVELFASSQIPFRIPVKDAETGETEWTSLGFGAAIGEPSLANLLLAAFSTAYNLVRIGVRVDI